MRQIDAIPRTFGELIAFLRAAWNRTYEDRCLQVAGDLTYTTLLAIVPLAAVTLAALSAFPVFAQWAGKVDDLIMRDLLPEAAGVAILAYLRQFAAQAAQLTALGLGLLVVTSLMLMMTIERAFNQIFRVSRARPIAQRLLIYWAVLTLGPILIGASVSMTSYLVSTSLGFARGLPIAGEALLRGVPVLLTCGAFTLLYLFVPNRHVRVRHALIGGFLAGLVFELMKRGFALYIAHFPTYTLIYGAFAVVPIFLVWLYFSWVTVMLGASITALLPGYRFSDPRRSAPGRRFFSALEVLAELAAAQRRGGAVPLYLLARQAGLAPESCERLLERMAELGWVARLPAERWMLARDAGQLTVADVHRVFVFDPDSLADMPERLAGSRIAEAHRALLSGALAVPLEELSAQDEAGKVTPLVARKNGR
ncbi:MAG TPA: YihY family inner membrane protein [Burkholderiales bacterium]|jgi:membrane protein|nr:YihY family inner membrane protein [Burkholderiales bacterium]